MSFSQNEYYSIVRFYYEINDWKYCFYWHPYRANKNIMKLQYIFHGNEVYYYNDINYKKINYTEDFERSYIISHFNELFNFHFKRDFEFDSDAVFKDIINNTEYQPKNEYEITINKIDDYLYELNDCEISFNDDHLIDCINYYNHQIEITYSDNEIKHIDDTDYFHIEHNIMY